MRAMYLRLLLAALFLASAAVAQPTFIERGLAELAESPAAGDGLDFIVVADSITLKPLEQSEIYTRSLAEFNLLGPDFVVHVGDIILGGAAEGGARRSGTSGRRRWRCRRALRQVTVGIADKPPGAEKAKKKQRISKGFSVPPAAQYSTRSGAGKDPSPRPLRQGRGVNASARPSCAICIVSA
jgi:hypothetical protein